MMEKLGKPMEDRGCDKLMCNRAGQGGRADIGVRRDAGQAVARHHRAWGCQDRLL